MDDNTICLARDRFFYIATNRAKAARQGEYCQHEYHHAQHLFGVCSKLLHARAVSRSRALAAKIDTMLDTYSK